MELIKRAILRDELHLFLLGSEDYRSSNWSDLPMPNDFNKIWYTDIIPYFNSLQDESFIKIKFKESIQ